MDISLKVPASPPGLSFTLCASAGTHPFMHAGQHVRIGAAAGRFWGIGCTAAQAVAAALLASGMASTVTARGRRPRSRSGRNSAHCWKCCALAWHERV